jgi:hypothetical protein
MAMDVKERLACLKQKLNKEVLEKCWVKISYRTAIIWTTWVLVWM